MSNCSKTLFVFIFILTSSFAFSQKAKTIKMGTYNLDPLPGDGRIPFAKIKVLPMLWDTTSLGFVQKGLDNSVATSKANKPIDEFLNGYIAAQYSHLMEPGSGKLLWVIKDLRVGERTAAMWEKSYVRLKADIYISADRDKYVFSSAFDTAILCKGGMDATSKHDDNIALAINLLLQESINKKDNRQGNTYTIEELSGKEQQRFAVPALVDTEFKNGVYASFDEFLQNKPSIDSFELTVVKRRVSVYAIAANGSKTALEKPWGVCRQGEIYKFLDGRLIPVEKKDRGYIVSTFAGALERRNSGIMAAAFLGGLAGAAIAEGSTKGDMYFVTGFHHISERFYPFASAIDMETGKLIF